MDERERWARVETLFHRALEYPSSDRGRFIEDECGSDADLRNRVEALLACDTLASPVDAPFPAAASARMLGHYRLISRLGAGGMGLVYLARDVRLDREVAIKVLPGEFTGDGDRRRRFQREAKAVSALSHPNIVAVYEFGREGEIDYLVMELVRGKTLDGLIPRTGLKVREALDYAVQIADAVGTAHAAGIVHRDLKPANVVVTADGVAKVLDFGIARVEPPRGEKVGAPASTETQPGFVIGTIAYMSPEQAEGKPVGPASDIFSFGSLLYEMITGRRAFERDSNVSTLAAILRDQPAPAYRLMEGVPKELSALIETCLRKDPAERPASMAEVSQSLRSLRSAGSARIRRPLWIAVGTAVLAIAAGLWWWSTRDQTKIVRNDAAVNFTPVPLTSYPGSETSPSFSPDGNQVAFAWDRGANEVTHIFVKLLGEQDALQLTKSALPDNESAWSPDGRFVAFARDLSHSRAVLMLVPAIGGPERTVAEFASTDLCRGRISWHPGNQWIAVAEAVQENKSCAVSVISIADGAVHRLTHPAAGLPGDAFPAFSPDGTKIAFVRRSAVDAGDLYLLEVSDALTPAAEPRRVTFDNRTTYSSAWTPDGRALVYVAGTMSDVALWRLPVLPRPGKPNSLGPAFAHAHEPALSRQGRLAYTTGTTDADIWRLDLSGEQKRGIPDKSEVRFISSTRLDHTPMYSPDGKRIAFASERSGSPEIWVCNADGSNAFRLTNFGHGYTANPYWSPDGEWIAFGAGEPGRRTVQVVRSRGGTPRQLTAPELDAGHGGWSNDGRWIYISAKSAIWKVPGTGGAPVHVTSRNGSVPVESPDGRFVYYVSSSDDVFGSLRRVPIGGGEEQQVVPVVFSLNFAVVNDGVYFIGDPHMRAPSFSLATPDPIRIQFLDLATGRTRPVATLRGVPAYTISLSPDRRYMLIPEYEDHGSDLMMVENFR